MCCLKWKLDAALDTVRVRGRWDESPFAIRGPAAYLHRAVATSAHSHVEGARGGVRGSKSSIGDEKKGRQVERVVI